MNEYRGRVTQKITSTNDPRLLRRLIGEYRYTSVDVNGKFCAPPQEEGTRSLTGFVCAYFPTSDGAYHQPLGDTASGARLTVSGGAVTDFYCDDERANLGMRFTSSAFHFTGNSANDPQGHPEYTTRGTLEFSRPVQTKPGEYFGTITQIIKQTNDPRLFPEIVGEYAYRSDTVDGRFSIQPQPGILTRSGFVCALSPIPAGAYCPSDARMTVSEGAVTEFIYRDHTAGLQASFGSFFGFEGKSRDDQSQPAEYMTCGRLEFSPPAPGPTPPAPVPTPPPAPPSNVSTRIM